MPRLSLINVHLCLLNFVCKIMAWSRVQYLALSVKEYPAISMRPVSMTRILAMLLLMLVCWSAPVTAVFLRADSDEYVHGADLYRGGYPSGWDSPQEYVCHSYVLPACNDDWPRCGCHKREYNVSAISRNLTALVIGNSEDQGGCGGSCMLSTFTPLPHLPNLTSIWLFDLWVAPDDGPFPLNRFLINVQATVTEMRLAGIHIPALTRETFAGFPLLTDLQLKSNRLAAISLDAFAFHGLPSKFVTIHIYEGNFTKFDWSVFAPAASTLERVSVMYSEVQEIYFTKYFAMPTLQTLSLAGNRLTHLNDSLLYSLTSPWVRPKLDLHSNPLCPSDADCDCPALKNLWEWLLRKPPLGYTAVSQCCSISDGVTCGNYTKGTATPTWSNASSGGVHVPRGKSFEGAQVTALAARRLLPYKSRGSIYPLSLFDFVYCTHAAGCYPKNRSTWTQNVTLGASAV